MIWLKPSKQMGYLQLLLLAYGHTGSDILQIIQIYLGKSNSLAFIDL